jgi:chalcone isomerase-like protein
MSRTKEEQQAQYKRSVMLSAAGIIGCALAMYGIIKLNVFGLPEDELAGKSEGTENEKKRNIQTEGPSGFSSSPSVIRIQGRDGVEQVATGNSTVPYFPSTMKLPESLGSLSIRPGQDIPATSKSEEYQLLGLGIRTVSFISIQVYVVGLYVAKSDISTLQQRLIRAAVHPLSDNAEENGVVAATSLVSSERDALKLLLLDPKDGEDVWNKILKDGGIRTALRIVPTRNTDFLHLRDGWVRGITARAQRANTKAKELATAGASSKELGSEFRDESFGNAVKEFKTVFGGGARKNVPKSQVLVLLRDSKGVLDMVLQPDPVEPMRWLGRACDERISRLIWLNYLAGKTVASEGARQSIVDGIMGIVERPVGTVVQKVI